jgi:hypothetical protein
MLIYSPVWQEIFSPLTEPLYIFGQLFSVLVSENADLLASLARDLFPSH